jgi:hypothetical protein
MVQVVEFLPSKYKALSSNSSNIKKKKELCTEHLSIAHSHFTFKWYCLLDSLRGNNLGIIDTLVVTNVFWLQDGFVISRKTGITLELTDLWKMLWVVFMSHFIILQFLSMSSVVFFFWEIFPCLSIDSYSCRCPQNVKNHYLGGLTERFCKLYLIYFKEN